MKDVRQLVGDDERVPVIVVAQPGCIGGRMRVHHDTIRRERRGVSVYVVDVVRDNEVYRSPRWYQLRRQLGVRAFGVDCRSSRLFLHRRREVHAKMGRAERPPMLVRRKLRARHPHRAETKRGDESSGSQGF